MKYMHDTFSGVQLTWDSYIMVGYDQVNVSGMNEKGRVKRRCG
jgi:hypothetical protein